MSKSLFQISQELLDLANYLEEEEFTPELEKNLEIRQEELQQKVTGYVQVIRNLEAEVEKAKEFEAQAKTYRAKKEKAIKRLKGSLQDAVELFGPQKADVVTVKLRKSSSVEVEDVNNLPKEYKVIKVSEQADKTKIKAALKEGKEIEGCSIVERQNLQIK